MFSIVSSFFSEKQKHVRFNDLTKGDFQAFDELERNAPLISSPGPLPMSF